jgi:Tfp pilus assembly protein PilF
MLRKPPSLRTTGAARTIGAFLVGVLGISLSGCHSGSSVPKQGSEAYTKAVSGFYVGLAALQAGDDVRADREFSQLGTLAAGEPAVWTDWGVLALRERNYDAAAQRLERARKLAPQNSHIYYLLGLMESDRGDTTAAIADLRKAVQLDPRNVKASYRLASEIERQSAPNSDAEAQNIIQQILTVRPNNLAALIELGRIAAKRGDHGALASAVERLGRASSAWPPVAQQQLGELQRDVSSSDRNAAATRTAFLRNVLMRVPEFRQSLAEISPPPGEEAEPFTHLLSMATPSFSPAAPDTAISFSPVPAPNVSGRWNWVGALPLGDDDATVLVEADGNTVRFANGATVPFPGGSGHVAPSPDAILAIDFNYDFKEDLVLAGAGGIRLLRQDNPNSFHDVTAASKLPGNVVNGNYLGAWAADIEADGDLDIVLGTAAGLPSTLRNNGDGTFTVIHPFPGVSGLCAFAWADLDGDGNPDASLIDGSGRLHVFHNDRGGQFHEVSLPANLPGMKALAVADLDGDGILDLLAVEPDGAIIKLSEQEDGRGWKIGRVATVPNAADVLKGEIRLHVADLDNNGALDLILARVGPSADAGARGAYVWLGDATSGFVFLGDVGPPRVFGVADLNHDGRLDLEGLTTDGFAVVAFNHGSRNYHWQVIRTRARKAVGDQRVNPFGIGGELEIRSGLLVQMQPITGPSQHFGLGAQREVDVVRVLWPNGTVSAEFALKPDQEVLTEQRLKGSCPFLFAFDGKSMKFVKDAVPWGSAIGLRINTLGTARVEATTEWYKIGGDQLAPRDGYYDLRFTADLWETYYYDHLSLMTVDHPAGTAVFVDERFSVPPPKLAIETMAVPHPIAHAVDDRGTDVTDIVNKLDGKYLDTFGRGQYQGITRDHYVEVDLGNDVPTSGPLWLIAQGWMHPTDSSVNVAVSQGRHPAAQGLSLEVPDGHGGWTVAEANLGFPAGRNKICLFDLSKVFRPGTPRKLRLRTNLEIYWDAIDWAKGLPATSLRIKNLQPEYADLHYRGYSVIHQANPSSPELPDYQQLEGSKQRWRDLVGYYTRYGDVRELLAHVDDRYVIMNSGDEMTLRFPALPPPPAGWVRDFVIAGDGWIKDGDYNSTFSRTVLPLPYHGRSLYVTPPGRLEDEYVYKHHPEDWVRYQTRYVSDEVFQNALRDRGKQ